MLDCSYFWHCVREIEVKAHPAGRPVIFEAAAKNGSKAMVALAPRMVHALFGGRSVGLYLVVGAKFVIDGVARVYQLTFQERPEAVKGAPLLGAAKQTLGGEERSEIIKKEGKAPAR